MKTINQKLCRILPIVALWFGVSFTSLSQSNFQPGFYITLDSDTIHGLINNKGGSGNFLACTFKKDESSKQLKFSAEEIIGYRFANGQFYISKKIEIKNENVQVFVEFLVDGISNLYFYRDLDNYFYLIENEHGDVLELNKEEIKNSNGSGQKKHDSYNHIRMLKLAFSDCMEIQPQVERAEFSHKSLINLTKDYHNYVCDDQECIVYEKKLSPPKIYFAPVIGMTSSSLQFDRDFYSGFEYDRSLNVTFGLQINAVLTRINERISLQLDLLYENNEFYGTYNNYYELLIKSSMFQSDLMIKYSFPKGKMRPTLGVGLLGNFFLNTKANAVVDNVPGSPPMETELNDIYMAKDYIGAVFQVGLNYRILKKTDAFTNFRYIISQGAAEGARGPVVTTINSLNLCFGIYLPKME